VARLAQPSELIVVMSDKPKMQCMDCGTTDPPELFYPIAAMSRPPNARFPGYQLCNPCERKRRRDLGGSLIIGPDPRQPYQT